MKTGVVVAAVVALGLGATGFLFHFPETEILCRIKGEGQARFKLQSGFISHKVLTRTTRSDWTAWCPTLDKTTLKLMPNNTDQTLKFAHGKAFCRMSQMERHGKLIWGTKVIDFNLPSWRLTYRYAALNETYADSRPGGRESASCQFVD